MRCSKGYRWYPLLQIYSGNFPREISEITTLSLSISPKFYGYKYRYRIDIHKLSVDTLTSKYSLQFKHSFVYFLHSLSEIDLYTIFNEFLQDGCKSYIGHIKFSCEADCLYV